MKEATVFVLCLWIIIMAYNIKQIEKEFIRVFKRIELLEKKIEIKQVVNDYTKGE